MSNEIKKTVAVIVTYNRIGLLKECIEALAKSDELVDVLIVNNASSDGTKEYLDTVDELHNDIKFYIYNMNENLNGAGGYNYGLNEAAKLNYKYIWLMDDDCIVNRNSYNELLKVADELNDNFGFLSSKVLWKDGSICKTNVQRKSVARKIRDFSSHIVNVDFASFVSCIVKTEDVLNVGLPIKEFIAKLQSHSEILLKMDGKEEAFKPAFILVKGDEPTQFEIDIAAEFNIPIRRINPMKYEQAPQEKLGFFEEYDYYKFTKDVPRKVEKKEMAM